MLYADGGHKDHWGAGESVPDVSRPETQLWFYFLAASFIDLGLEAIHFGQVELMNHQDRDLAHYARVLSLIRGYAAQHARRHMLLCTDPAGHLEMPGSRTIYSPLNHRSWYFANRPSPSVPDGLGDEEAIRDLWANE